jgi:hypothetical protein
LADTVAGENERESQFQQQGAQRHQRYSVTVMTMRILPWLTPQK